MAEERFLQTWFYWAFLLSAKDTSWALSPRPQVTNTVIGSSWLPPSWQWVTLVWYIGVVIACTAYACYTEEDWTTSSLIVIILAAILFLLFIVTLFTDSPFIKNLYCGVGVFLFSIYLIIDTQMIMGGKSLELSVDDYALAAMLLYIDIIQIFLYILQLLSNNNNDWGNDKSYQWESSLVWKVIFFTF